MALRVETPVYGNSRSALRIGVENTYPQVDVRSRALSPEDERTKSGKLPPVKGWENRVEISALPYTNAWGASCRRRAEK